MLICTLNVSYIQADGPGAEQQCAECPRLRPPSDIDIHEKKQQYNYKQ